MSKFVLAAITLASVAAPAAAQNYNRSSCQQLWVARNQIYKEAGYCFNTPRGVRYFGNAGCQYDRQSDVPLSHADRREIDTIVRIEAEKRCAD